MLPEDLEDRRVHEHAREHASPTPGSRRSDCVPQAIAVAVLGGRRDAVDSGVGERIRDRSVLDELVEVGAREHRAAVADRQEVRRRSSRRSARRVTNGNRSVGMLSLIGITRPRRLSRSAGRRRYRGPRLSAGRGAPTVTIRHGSDGVAVERERPVLGEARRPRAAAREQLGRVAVLDVAPALDVELDRHRRRLRRRVEVRDPDLLYPWAADHQAVVRRPRGTAAR